MDHADASMIMKIYARMSTEKEIKDTSRLNDFTRLRFVT